MRNAVVRWDASGNKHAHGLFFGRLIFCGTYFTEGKTMRSVTETSWWAAIRRVRHTLARDLSLPARGSSVERALLLRFGPPRVQRPQEENERKLGSKGPWSFFRNRLVERTSTESRSPPSGGGRWYARAHLVTALACESTQCQRSEGRGVAEERERRA